MNQFLWQFSLLQISRNLKKKWQIISPLPYNTCVCIWIAQRQSIHSYSLPSKGNLDNHWTLHHMHNVNTSTMARDPSWKTSFFSHRSQCCKTSRAFFPVQKSNEAEFGHKAGVCQFAFFSNLQNDEYVTDIFAFLKCTCIL